MKNKFFILKKKDILPFIGFIIGLVGAFHFSLLAGILVIIISLISKIKKSEYWSILFFGGLVLILMYLVETFWVN